MDGEGAMKRRAVMVTLWLLYYAAANAVRWLFRRKRVPVAERVTVRMVRRQVAVMGLDPETAEFTEGIAGAVARGMAKRKARR